MPEHWLAEAKLAVVIETATLSEIELSQHCRKKGLYPEQVNAWRQACLMDRYRPRTSRRETKADKKRIRDA